MQEPDLKRLAGWPSRQMVARSCHRDWDRSGNSHVPPSRAERPLLQAWE